MKTLLIMRHAKSSWKEAGTEDHERPLNDRGKRDAPRMGRLLREQELTPDLILSSTARRARKTAEAVADESGCREKTKSLDALYPGDPEDFVRALGALPDSCGRVLVVGHNPGVEDLVHLLAGEEAAMPTAAIAQVDLAIEDWAELSDATAGVLVRVWRPKELE